MCEKDELITVIVPVYNVEKYLERCIDSIILQTYKNLEILLVNDGSTDDSLSICRRYSEQDSRIRVIDKTNGGLGSARNAGIDAMKGAYVAFIDSDDYISESMVKRLYDLIKKQDAEVSVCDFCAFDDRNVYRKKRKTRIQTFNRDQAMKNMFYPDGIKWNAWNKLYKASLFKTIRYKEGVYSEDMATTYKVFFETKKVVYTNEQLYYYYHRSDGIMLSKPVKRYCDEMRIINDQMVFFQEHLPHLAFYPKAFCGKIALNNYIGIKKAGGHEDDELKCLFYLKKYWKFSCRARFVKFKYKILIVLFMALDAVSFGYFKQSRLFNAFCKRTKYLK